MRGKCVVSLGMAARALDAWSHRVTASQALAQVEASCPLGRFESRCTWGSRHRGEQSDRHHHELGGGWEGGRCRVTQILRPFFGRLIVSVSRNCNRWVGVGGLRFGGWFY